jgi:outer membrane protein OmpA-like peptidoglycan-associated protein
MTATALASAEPQEAGLDPPSKSAVGPPDLRLGLNTATVAHLQHTIGNRAVARLLSANGGRPGSGQRILARKTSDAEIRRSRESPGLAEAQEDPAALSLFNFGHDQAEVKEFHHDLMIELARFIRDEIPVGVRVRVEGHTSAPGSDAYNIDLGRRRAEAIAEILRANGVTDVDVGTRGESTPVGDNSTEDGRSRNRRVDVRLFKARQPSPTPTPPEPGPEPKPEPKPVPVPPEPIPPQPPEPPGPNDDKGFCDRYPLLCGLLPLIPIPFLLPPPWALICIIAPELCAVGVCVVNPALCIPDPPEPKPPKPPDKPKKDKKTPRVVFGRVRAANTPSAMGDRIPDTGSTLVPVTVFDFDPAMAAIVIRPVGANATNGDFLIDGGTTTTITGTHLLEIKGQTQTTDRAGAFKLRLEAVLGATSLGESAPFAVSDIMENMRTRKADELVDKTGASLFAGMLWDSDGANGIKSLNLMEYGENIKLLSEEGGMVGLGAGDHGFLVLADQEQQDQHGTPIEVMKAPGRQQLLQVHTLVDHRTGSLGEDIPVTNSGFLIDRVVEPDPARPGCLRFVITKSGRAGAVGRFTSGAGSGRAQLIVPLKCPGGGRPPRPGGGPKPTPSLPKIHGGPVPKGSKPFGYVSGVPASAFPGLPVILTIVFEADSTDPKRPGRKKFTSPIPCVVVGTTATHINLETSNPVPLSLAPDGFELTVMPAFNKIGIPRSLL